MADITINGDTILLAQFLKWANIAATGGEAKFLISQRQVRVNGEIETRRGRQLHPGDTVTVNNVEYTVAAQS